MFKRWGWLWMGLACCSLAAGAQRTVTVKPPAVSPAASQPSNMTLNVQVRNRADQPVTGLSASDFTVLDNGSPVPIESFAAYDAAVAPPPEQVIFVIDDVNTDPTDLIYARRQMQKFLAMHEGRLPVPVSIMLLTDSHLKQIAAPSRDGSQLAAELKSLPGLIREMPVGGIYHAQDRMEISLRGLTVLAAVSERMPGRKLVIWISPGWWMFDNPRVMLWDEQEKASYQTVVGISQILRQAQITLDAVDPLGERDAGALHTYLWKSFLKPVTRWQKAQPADLALQVLAAQSGGRVLSGGNNVAEELNACLSDAPAYYSITFAVPGAAADAGLWHNVDVRVKAPGAAIRTANGYYALPPR